MCFCGWTPDGMRSIRSAQSVLKLSRDRLCNWMILNEPSEITEWWRWLSEHTERLKCFKYGDHPRIRRKTEKDIERTGEQWNENMPPTIDDVRKATERLKNKRLPGPDNIIAKLLKKQWDITEVQLHKTVCQTWKEEIPEQWEDGFIWPIHKKGDWLVLNYYRGITWLNTEYKIFSNILYERLQPYMENIVGQYQYGFRIGKSTTDQIQSTRQILVHDSEYGIHMFHFSRLPVTQSEGINYLRLSTNLRYHKG